MKILLTLFVLFFSSSVFAEFPTKLFGVELNDDIKNYTKNQKSMELSDHGFLDWYYVDLEKLIPNLNFESYRIFQDENDIIVSIQGYKPYDNLKVSDCVEDANQLSDFLKSKYELSKEFEINYIKESFYDSLSEEYILFNVYERKVTGTVKNKKSLLQVSCEFPDRKTGRYRSFLHLKLQNYSFEKKEDEKNILEYVSFNEFVKNFKELGYNDFVGL